MVLMLTLIILRLCENNNNNLGESGDRRLSVLAPSLPLISIKTFNWHKHASMIFGEAQVEVTHTLMLQFSLKALKLTDVVELPHVLQFYCYWLWQQAEEEKENDFWISARGWCSV